MNSEVKKKLRDLYINEGVSLFGNSTKLNAYLNDILYAYGVEKNVLSTIIRAGYVSKILNEVKSEKDFPKTRFYVEQIASQYGISRENALSAVDAIIYAVHGKDSKITLGNSNSGTTSGGTQSGNSGGNKLDIPTPIKLPPNTSPSGNGNTTNGSKKKVWPWVLAAVILFFIIVNAVGNSGTSKPTNGSSITTTETMNYVTTTNLTNLTYIYKDENISVGNSMVTTNAGTQCANYIETESPYAEIIYPLNGNFDGLTATWALSEYGKNTEYKHSVEIFADGVSVYKSPTLTAGDVPVNVSAKLNYCDALTIVLCGVKEHAFLGDIQLTSSQTNRVYNNNITSNIRTYTWLANMDDMGDDKMIVWKDTWVQTNVGTYLVNPINPYVPSYSNTDVIEFKETGSYIDYFLGGEYAGLSGTCAIDEHKGTLNGNMKIQILADDSVIYTSPLLSGTSSPSNFDINVSGCQKLKIKFIPSGDGKWGYDAASFSIGNLKLYK